MYFDTNEKLFLGCDGESYRDISQSILKLESSGLTKEIVLEGQTFQVVLLEKTLLFASIPLVVVDIRCTPSLRQALSL